MTEEDIEYLRQCLSTKPTLQAFWWSNGGAKKIEAIRKIADEELPVGILTDGSGYVALETCDHADIMVVTQNLAAWPSLKT